MSDSTRPVSSYADFILYLQHKHDNTALSHIPIRTATLPFQSRGGQARHTALYTLPADY
jgi:hypothetical protein